jgi:hypothetical protein
MTPQRQLGAGKNDLQKRNDSNLPQDWTTIRSNGRALSPARAEQRNLYPNEKSIKKG